MSLVKSSNRKRLENDAGGATVEFVLWLPVFMLIVALIVDATLLLQTQSRFFDVARTASRQVALGIMNEAEAENYVLEAFGNNGSFSASVATDKTGNLVTTTIEVPFSKIMIMSSNVSAFGGASLSASISMVKEASGLES